MYVCFLDDDDEFLENHLAYLSDFLKKNNLPVKLISTNLYFRKNNELSKKEFEDYGITNSFNILPYVPTVCIHKIILTEHLFNENLVMREDHELFDRIRNRYGIITLQKHTVIVNKHDENFTADKYKVRKGLEKTTHFYIWDRKRLGKEELIKLHECYLFLLIHYSRKRKVSKALQYALKTLSILPLAFFIRSIRSQYLKLSKKIIKGLTKSR